MTTLRDDIAQAIADAWDHARDPVEMCDVFAGIALRVMAEDGERQMREAEANGMLWRNPALHAAAPLGPTGRYGTFTIKN